MSLPEVETIVRDRLGLDPAALGPSVLPRAIQARMSACRLSSPEAYLELLADGLPEADALAGELVVSETWFFRGGPALYQRLAQLVARRAAERPGTPVRILSLPCSTGEEPYSLVISLIEAGIPREAVRIDGVDLCGTSVQKAMAARYSAFAFRELGADPRLTYFRASGSNWVASSRLRRTVHFRTGNLIDPTVLAAEAPYDLILCRNLFIYLTPEGRKQAIAALDRLLTADGVLCVTPAEADRLPPGQFVADGPIEYGLFRRNPIRAVAASAVVRPRRPKATAVPPAGPPSAEPAEASIAVASTASTLDQARGLADRGRLAAARDACDELIRARIDLPEAYTLLATIHQAEGREADAMEAVRKALYLAPDQPEALTQMILLYTARGESPRAEALRNRLKRLTAEGRA